MSRYEIIKEAFKKYNKNKEKECKHVFVDGYEATTYEVYKKCIHCGLEKDYREMNTEDAEKYLGVLQKLTAVSNKEQNTDQTVSNG